MSVRACKPASNLASSASQPSTLLPSHLSSSARAPSRQSVDSDPSWRWSVPCPGLPIEWDMNIFWIHTQDQPKYELILSEFPKVRSKQCRGAVVTAAGLLPCSNCSALKVDIRILEERACRPYKKIRNHDTLNSEQLHEKVTVVNAKLNTLKLKNLDLEDSLARDFHFIGQNPIPALHRLLANAEKEGWSAKKILEQCQLAKAGKYTARNFPQYEIDLTILMYELGEVLLSSVNGLKLDNISRNITTLFGTTRRQHLSTLESVKIGKDTRMVEAAVTAVKAGTVHISHETCVGAISRLYETGYGARPVFMGPTCKKGPWQDMLRTMEAVVEAWKCSPDGEAKHGPALSIATDGDHKRRLALFVMCMQLEILPGNPLYPFIRNLPGLNRRVGKDNITNDSDPKHIDKLCSICTTLCSPEGIAGPAPGWLERLPNHDWSDESIHSLLDPSNWLEINITNLLNPSDAQDVSRAIKLLLSIVRISELDSDDFDPSEAAEFEALCVLGEALDALSTIHKHGALSCSHLLCALYIQNGTSFMPNQLYADIQAMIKNAVLIVPKTRLLNGQLKVFICLLGDDVLEALFGRSRIGGHSPNCSTGELRDRFASAMRLDHIYEQHPELERKPRRLNMFRIRHVDHLRPSHFKRELCADSCDLEVCWSAAVKAAESILAKYGVRMTMTFAERFRMKDTDLSRPLGGKYPAISGDVDRSMANHAGVDFDAMIASEKASESSDLTPHSLFAEIDTAGHLAHKKTILRTFFDMTQDSSTSHDRLQRIRDTQLGENLGIGTAEKPLKMFRLPLTGNLFATFIGYNGTHVGLAVAKMHTYQTLHARVEGRFRLCYSTRRTSLAEIALHNLRTDIFSRSSARCWHGLEREFSLIYCREKKSNGEDVSHLRNLQFAVSSRLVDCTIHERARETLLSDTDLSSEREKTWSFLKADLQVSWHELWNRLISDSSLHEKFPTFASVSDGIFPYQLSDPTSRKLTYFALPIANTPIEQFIINRNACRVCPLCAVEDPSVKFPVCRNIVPVWYLWGPTLNGACKIAIKGGKADSDCPSAYAFLIAAAGKFHDKRPCTNIPLSCPLDCREVHWKYNWHLEDRHPDWRQLSSARFIEQIQISTAEQLGLNIPADKSTPRPRPSTPDPVQGSKRSAACLQSSPSRRDKENEDPKDTQIPKRRRVTLILGPRPAD
ncbi:hypothetical protein B0H13DRAFT_2125344 [Mycena leptocephala]|nr:hypothetical protein B0H13DRAFT_2125344 [Mycena leptocephala]